MSWFNKNEEKQILDYNGNRIYINGLLLSCPEYKQPVSVVSGEITTFDNFFSELTPKFYKKITKNINEENTKKVCLDITTNMAYTLNNLVNIPSSLREFVLQVVQEFVSFLKTAVSYPNVDTVNSQVLAYLPFLKELAIAAQTFITNNK